MQEFGIYLNIGTIMAFAVALVGITRKFTRVEGDVEAAAKSIEAHVKSHEETREMTDARIENITRDLKALDRDVVIRQDTLRLETGEMGAALRQKIHDVEITSRDRIDMMAAGIRESIEKLGERLELKIERAMRRDQ